MPEPSNKPDPAQIDLFDEVKKPDFIDIFDDEDEDEDDWDDEDEDEDEDDED